MSGCDGCNHWSPIILKSPSLTTDRRLYRKIKNRFNRQSDNQKIFNNHLYIILPLTQESNRPWVLKGTFFSLALRGPSCWPFFSPYTHPSIWSGSQLYYTLFVTTRFYMLSTPNPSYLVSLSLFLQHLVYLYGTFYKHCQSITDNLFFIMIVIFWPWRTILT